MARILVTDDARFMRLMLVKILKRQGHEIVGEAQNGEEAIEKYARLRPELLTMDVVMPKLNGIKAVQKIMQLDPRARIIMVTALGQEAMVKEAIKSGAKDYVVKPFKTDQVIKAVERVLARARA